MAEVHFEADSNRVRIQDLPIMGQIFQRIPNYPIWESLEMVWNLRIPYSLDFILPGLHVLRWHTCYKRNKFVCKLKAVLLWRFIVNCKDFLNGTTCKVNEIRPIEYDACHFQNHKLQNDFDYVVNSKFGSFHAKDGINKALITFSVWSLLTTRWSQSWQLQLGENIVPDLDTEEIHL